MDDINLLGKVDTSRTYVTPDSFNFRIKEAIQLNNFDYEKYKKEALNGKPPAVNPKKESAEIEADKKFQELCKELWPNIYRKSEDRSQDKNFNELLNELDKKKALYDSIFGNDLKQYSLVKQAQASPTLNSFSRMDNALGIPNSSQNSQPNGNINIYIDGMRTKQTSVTINQNGSETPSKPLEKKTQITVSSYNNPYDSTSFCAMKKCPYTDIYSDRLGMKVTDKPTLNDFETLDAVDKIVDKSNHLQSEMKKTASDLRLKIQDLKIKADLDEQIKKATSECRSRSRSRSISNICCHSSSACSRERKNSRSSSRPKSIMKTTQSKYNLRSTSPAVTFRLTQKEVLPYSSTDSSSSESYGIRDWSYIEPKVKCWNCNCKKDKNIY